jgi:hypothetical protein
MIFPGQVYRDICAPTKAGKGLWMQESAAKDWVTLCGAWEEDGIQRNEKGC